MISALLFLQYHSTRNRLLSQIRRLKQPKYLVPMIAGGAYFYFYFFQALFSRGRGRGWSEMPPETLALLQSAGALALFGIVLLAWVIPHQRAALTFTEAEIAFLFPAPVRRRWLIHFKLLRSQLRIFVTVFILTLLSNRLGGKAWIHAAGWWLGLSTLNLHLLGSSFALTMLLDRGISNWLRRGVILGILAAAAGIIFVWAKNTLPPLDLSGMDGMGAVKAYARELLSSGPVPYLLYPFKLVVRPYFSPDAASFFRALGPVVAIIALHYWWVVRSDVAFEEASIEASQKLAARIAAVREGNFRGGQPRARVKRPPFKLTPAGFPPIALFWKNLISAGQLFSWRLWIMLAMVGTVMLMASGVTSRHSDVLSIVSMVCGMFLAWSLMIGPQFLRQDLRQDLQQADVLKGFPMRGWQIVLGEILAPAVILTAVQWLLLIFASAGLWKIQKLPAGLPLALTCSLAMLFPALNAVMLLIPNAGVLLFPVWFQPGKEGPQGIEATGQRLIMLAGQMLAFLVSIVPAAGVFLLVFFFGRVLIGPIAMLMPASFLAALVLAGEAWLGVILLGRVFERFDLSAELAS